MRNGAPRGERHTLKHASDARIEANPAAALAYREQNVHDRFTCGKPATAHGRMGA
jgi:hypothetical protein